MSKKYSLNLEDLVKILKAFLYSLVTASFVFLIGVVNEIDFGEYVFLAPFINAVLLAGEKAWKGER